MGSDWVHRTERRRARRLAAPLGRDEAQLVLSPRRSGQAPILPRRGAGAARVASLALWVAAACACSGSHEPPDGSVDGSVQGPRDGSVDGMDGGASGPDGSARQDGSGPRTDGAAITDAADRPDAGGPQPCETPGTFETVECGLCGQAERFCTADQIWARGACQEEGECRPGELREAACGMCGTRMELCTTECVWQLQECTSEGVCVPGTRTTTTDGCPSGQRRELACTDACELEEVEACSADVCDPPGRIENVDCGMCGTQERFCSADGVWTYEACSGEGVCSPGATTTESCGMCGTRQVRCTESCGWDRTTTCTGQGECSPGERQLTFDGCPDGQSRVMECSDSCSYAEVEGCAVRGADVMILLDMTGSHGTNIETAQQTIFDELVQPLLDTAGVRVGLARYEDFPLSPYGGSSDRPFTGIEPPTTSAAPLQTALANIRTGTGGDMPESGVQALHILAGGSADPYSSPFSCDSGLEPGGCWRAGHPRAVVILTDAPNHNGPRPDGSAGLYEPYAISTATPAEWPDVRDRMMAAGIGLFVLCRDSTTAADQSRRMVADLGEASSQVVEYSAGLRDPIRTMLPELRSYLGLP